VSAKVVTPAASPSHTPSARRVAQVVVVSTSARAPRERAEPPKKSVLEHPRMP
jgi:hypothetical protein